MNTISPNDDMFADFYEVGGYSNLAGASARLVAGRNSKLVGARNIVELAQQGRSSKGLVAIAFRRYTQTYDKLVQDFGLSDERINQLWNEFRQDGGTSLSNFYSYVQGKEESKIEEQIINEQNTITDTDKPEPNTPKEKKKFPYLIVSIGAVVLVGATILIMRSKK